MPTEPHRRDFVSMITPVVFIAVGTVAIWDTLDYADADSYVFPRAIAGAMIVFSIALIVWNLIKAPAHEPNPPGSTPRRVGLVAAMLAGALLMPAIGFLVAGLLSFGAILWLAMWDRWTRFALIVYPLAGMGIVIGFYVLFSKVFQVPLPVGSLFGG